MAGPRSTQFDESTDSATPTSARHPVGVTHLVIEVSLPDRPGALGAVASRIGAVGGDITDVIVAGRHAGFADDVFHVELPMPDDAVDMVGLVLDEISQVDGVSAPSVSYTDTGDCCP